MKIGLLTFHRAHNYGAVLQCYALQEVLKGMGHEVEVIDYRQPAIEAAYDSWHLRWFLNKFIKVWKMHSYLLQLYKESKLRKIFQDFLNGYLNVQHTCTFSDIPDCYDYYVIGSDQLFNLEITHGLDPVYSGKFEKSNRPKMIGYAISSNQESIKLIGQNEWDKIFKRFCAISFREKALADLLFHLYGKKVDVCIDPTLLTDRKVWEKVTSKHRIVNDCIVLYEVRCNEGEEHTLTHKAYHLAKQLNTEVVNLSKKEYTVEEWILYIKHAKCIITSSFHASAFALIFNRPLYSFILNDGKDSRYVDLLNSVGASICIKKISDTVDEVPKMDFERINRKLQLMRENSINVFNEYLK